MSVCTVQNCGRNAVARGYCNAHYLRFKKYGNPKAGQSIGDKSGELNPKWRGGVSKMPDGRVLVYCPNHPFVSVAGKYVLRYRLVMEKHLGRYLQPDEIVHHKNGIKDDDRIENLEILKQSEHAKGHYSTRQKNEKGQLCK